jgi:hypothetical protein
VAPEGELDYRSGSVQELQRLVWGDRFAAAGAQHPGGFDLPSGQAQKVRLFLQPSRPQLVKLVPTAAGRT